ncbi:hypothetical protein [Streptomyces longwoodensis]|uniref:hypothetical protein n=1 Tax=Streptomyces longwoodensis TaxID=68231 RepID=UPI0033DDC72D
MNHEFPQWPPERPVRAALDDATGWLLVDGLEHAEAADRRAERAHWARTVEALGLGAAREDRPVTNEFLQWLRNQVGVALQPIVELHEGQHRCPEFDQYPGGRRFVDPDPPYPAPGPCSTLRVLGAAYASRPGYRDEWRP